VNNSGRLITISLVDPEFDIGAHEVETLDGDERPHLGFGIGAWPTFSSRTRRMSSPAQGFG
jgi:hypothetical protein